MDPNVTDQECPIAGTATETTGEKPRATRSGATTAIGFVCTESLDADTDCANGTCFIYDMIQKKSCPDNIKNIKGKQHTFHLGMGNQFRVSAEDKR
jgi:hypothetical protein